MQKPQKPESKPSLYRWCHSKAHGWTAQSHLVRKEPKPFAHLSGRQRVKARKLVRRSAKLLALWNGPAGDNFKKAIAEVGGVL